METPHFIRPKPLTAGSRVAALSLSSGFVSEVPQRYAAGVRQARESLGWDIVAAPNAFRGAKYLYANPQARADDLHWALESPGIDGMVSIIGGDDSIRLLPLLDRGLLRAHPKAFLGYSDSTVTLMQFLQAGVMAYHGPAVLTDLAENGGMHPYAVRSIQQAFGSEAICCRPRRSGHRPSRTGRMRPRSRFAGPLKRELAGSGCEAAAAKGGCWAAASRFWTC
ncbi:LD-carboxypeptidase [Deinococcus sp. SL84]|uniref:LD-carboxypeptidase n=1 Tax=Deinococcus sp. SL84 TaxID=2994663 RepID=UPI00227596CA|nr:LD-carboxypeptidase [Deinococcus sp. SL84]MCY1702395.1 LD-carboxypeptidase [Deinococcus sp. SL84]